MSNEMARTVYGGIALNAGLYAVSLGAAWVLPFPWNWPLLLCGAVAITIVLRWIITRYPNEHEN